MKVRTAGERFSDMSFMPLWPIISVLNQARLEETKSPHVIKEINLLGEIGIKISGRFFNYQLFMNLIKDLYDCLIKQMLC